MGNVQIISTLENERSKKRSVHNSSSAVFFAIYDSNNGIDTEISVLNHFILKRGILDVVATIEMRETDGKLVKKLNIEMNEERAYSFRLSEHLDEIFIGSVYLFFKSQENLAIPFCAVMCSINAPKSVCGLHTYGRRLEEKELGKELDFNSTVETGWTARDSKEIKSFAILHGGAFELNISLKLEILNSLNQVITIEKDFLLKPFGTFIVVPQDLDNSIIDHLKGKKGHIKVHINGIRGIFPRMLCGNYTFKEDKFNSLTSAQEIQFTHTNFDFTTIKQPDSGGNLGYYNQPSIPDGYGIVYPVETKKFINIGKDRYKNNSIYHINIKKMSQVEVSTENDKLPSRFIAAAVGKWKGQLLESECSTGIIIEDMLKVPCRWHWGLLKPGHQKGQSVISIILSKFNRCGDLSRTVKLRLFDEKSMLTEKEFIIDGNKEIQTKDILPSNLAKGAIWYVFSGSTLEDLNIFSTFYPENKAGYVEHAF